MRKKWQLSLRKETIFFAVLSYFFKSYSEKRIVLVIVGIKKQMKQNAKNGETKIFIEFI